MNILVDGRTLCRYSAGISTFLHCALDAWSKESSEHHFYIVLPKAVDNKDVLIPERDNVHYIDCTSRFTKRIPNILILQAIIPYLCRKYDIGLYYAPVPHIPFFLPSKVKTLATVHDVVNIELPHTMSWTNRLASKVFFTWAVNHADKLWCNSRYTRSKVEEYFPRRKSQDMFVGCSVNRDDYHPQNLSPDDVAALKKRIGIDGRFLLFVGSLEPRKNLSFLLTLLPRLYRQHGLKLVVVGAKKWKCSDVSQIVEAPDFPREAVVFCNYISNDELARLYASAECFVSTALNEGFGMPQLEAMLCGCPVVTAHNSAMVEVAEGKSAATTVVGYDAERWIEAIVDMVNRHPEVDQSQLKDYDWTLIVKVLSCLVV